MSEAAILNRTWHLSHQFDGEPEPRTWELARPSPGMWGEYAKVLERRAIMRIKAHADILTDYDYRVLLDGMRDCFINGDYEPGRDKFWKTLLDEENRRQLLRLWIEDTERKHELNGMKGKRLALKRNQKVDQLAELWDANAEYLWAEDGETGIVQQMLLERNPTRRPAPKEEANP